MASQGYILDCLRRTLKSKGEQSAHGALVLFTEDWSVEELEAFVKRFPADLVPIAAKELARRRAGEPYAR